MGDDRQTVYVVAEDKLDEKCQLRRVFDNAEAANAYVDHPQQTGYLFVEQLPLESDYDGI